MTSPYITFEEMEEGVECVSRCKATGALSVFVFRKFDGTPCVRSIDDLWIPTRPDDGLLLYPIPVYSPPNSWDEYIHDLAEYPEFNTDGKFGYIHGDFRKNSSDKCLKAAIDWLQDELDRRQKAGES